MSSFCPVHRHAPRVMTGWPSPAEGWLLQDLLLVGGQVPHVDGAVVAAHDDPLTVRRHRHCVDSQLVALLALPITIPGSPERATIGATGPAGVRIGRVSAAAYAGGRRVCACGPRTCRADGCIRRSRRAFLAQIVAARYAGKRDERRFSWNAREHRSSTNAIEGALLRKCGANRISGLLEVRYDDYSTLLTGPASGGRDPEELRRRLNDPPTSATVQRRNSSQRCVAHATRSRPWSYGCFGASHQDVARRRAVVREARQRAALQTSPS